MTTSLVRRASSAVAVTVLALTAGACAKESGTKIAVTGTNDACTPAVTEIAAGKVTFEFTNRADKISELYVLRDDNSVAAEVENVTTGTKRSLTADLAAGSYVLACKPGQQGDGIRTEFTVTGKGGTAAPTADRTVAVTATEYKLVLPTDMTISKGETIAFTLTNSGTIQHEMEVFEPNGEALGEIGPTNAGATGSVTLTFDETGTYRFVCGIDGHEKNGMVTTVEVAG